MIGDLIKITIAVMMAAYLIQRFLRWVNEVYQGILNWFEMNFGLFFDQSYFHVLVITLLSIYLYRKFTRSIIGHRVINYLKEFGIIKPSDI